MDKDDKHTALTLTEQEEEVADERTVYLNHGRTLAIASEPTSEIIEIRASSGQVELRVRMTEDGPVLQLDAVKLEVNAESSVAIACQSFSVEAEESVNIASKAGLRVQSQEELQIESKGDVRVAGEKIWLN